MKKTYNKGVLNGKFTEYYQNGKIKAEGIYLNDEMVWDDYVSYLENDPKIIDIIVLGEKQKFLGKKASKIIITTLKIEGKLRKEPSVFSAVFLLISKEQRVQVSEYYAGYYKLWYSGKQGCLNEIYLNETYDMLALKNE
ncbi:MULTISPECIES: hypothetical protein [unclassified Polaribacter]|uniref:hypothetical protein n=1 Tax=unclassified Polaribacter TaxID=196858 RepID=UPI0011BF276E|nr:MULTISPECIES: hypothetical protein [unclassified Polaribacter]TXD51686.1 hypothetical protein ES043_10745 [Polaribacter sp. IC063]TXD59563.1 hypothetical protein ES044_09835 [Polaribacter sp. IC066]